jgi:hypothetical protein
MFSVEAHAPRPPERRAEHGCGGADISACAVQLCVEHGISNDGILQDFATQASVSIIFTFPLFAVGLTK